MATITHLRARELLDSRGNPTVEVEVKASTGHWGRAIAPAGASTGTHEARELRDGDTRRYRGKGTLNAVRQVVDIIAPALLGHPLADQSVLDDILESLDDSGNFAQLGANAVLAVSLALAHARASARQLPLYQVFNPGFAPPCMPLPMINMISGGLHAGRQIEFQDFLILPVGAKSLREALEWSVSVYRHLGDELAQRGLESALVGDEGGFGPRLDDNHQALDLLIVAIELAGFIPGEHIALGLDVAATHFFHEGRYWLGHGTTRELDLDADAMIETMVDWVNVYPIVSIEDALAEDDWEGWAKLTAALAGRVQLIGDDFLVTNPHRLERAVGLGCANAILVKPNQIGTLSKTLAVLRAARQAGYNTIVSARSGETEDTTIADLAVGTSAGQIKIGSIARGERLAKYNQLLRIEEELLEAGTTWDKTLGWHLNPSRA